MQHLTEDAKAILLLCGRFSSDKGGNSEKPLSLAEYNRLADWMVDCKLRPFDLLEPTKDRWVVDPSLKIDDKRLQRLLARGTAMALAVEKWHHSGIWIVCRSDREYPQRLKRHLGRQAPPVLFGVGDIGLLALGGMAIVGSRNVDAVGEAFTRRVAHACARDDLAVVSGGARGVDQTSMLGALEAGGKVVGILADSLQKAALAGKYRSGIREGRLALVSPFHPGARFHVGNAMGRNKYIYAISDFALVISAEVKKGGTWAGATEELKRPNARPVYVRMAEDIPQGNRALLDLGARSFPPPPWAEGLKHLLFRIAPTPQKNRVPSQQSLFGGEVQPTETETVREEAPLYPEVAEKRPLKSPPSPARSEPNDVSSIYDAVLLVLLRATADWISAADLAEKLDVGKGQLYDWLKQAVKEAVIEKKSHPVKFSRITPAPQKNRVPSQQSLFGGDLQPAETGTVKEEAPVYPEAVEKRPPPSTLPPACSESEDVLSIYDAVLPVLLGAMADWISVADLAAKLDVGKGQLNDWLKQAAKEAVIEKKNRPVQYRRVDHRI